MSAATADRILRMTLKNILNSKTPEDALGLDRGAPQSDVETAYRDDPRLKIRRRAVDATRLIPTTQASSRAASTPTSTAPTAARSQATKRPRP